jgi:hypothetical protein
MAALLWITIGVPGAVTLVLVVSLAAAAVLGQIGRQVTELLEFEMWTSAPITVRRTAAGD